MKATVSKNASGLPPVRASRTKPPRDPNRRWYLEATVVLKDGSFQIERVEANSLHGRAVMDRWGLKRVQHQAVDYIKVEPVIEPTKSREAGFLTKSERPTEVIGLSGGPDA